MKVILIFPVAFQPENIPIILKEFKETIAPKLNQLGATTIEIKFASNDYVYVPIHEKLRGTPKGKGIIQILKNVTTLPDIIIMCDGSGAIPYHYIGNAFQELTADSSTCCVMANRVGDKAIAWSRYLIERFEIFLLKEFHHHYNEIPDGQCGLWCYKSNALDIDGCKREINLVSEGYGIELDLLSEVLQKKLNYSFIDIKLPERKAGSSFSYENNLKKMQFLLKKYPSLITRMEKNCADFEQTQEFKEISKKGEDVSANWDKYKGDLLKLSSS